MKRYIHGLFRYKCKDCDLGIIVGVEKGLEERCNPRLKKPSKQPHKPTPYVIGCPDCGGMMYHNSTMWFEDFEEATRGYPLFMNVKKSDCGKFVKSWGGE